jgi:Flp pilus assembly protein TadG
MRMREENGGSLVELAIVVVLLFVIVFGIIEFGILLYDKAVITNASREGARAGIVFDPGFRNDDGTVNDSVVRGWVTNIVTGYCSANLFSFGSGDAPAVDVSDLTGLTSGGYLTVTVTYPFHFLVFSNLIALLGGGSGNLVNLKAVTVMRLE